MKITVFGNPATKKNSLRVIQAGGFTRIMPSKAYTEYEKRAIAQIRASRVECLIDYPVNVKAVYYMRTRRAVDLANLNSAIHDILVRAAVLEDDNRDIIAATDGSRVMYDKDNPRVEIEITAMNGIYDVWKKRA